jgi:UDP-N-acetylglucosamine--N-acetylmuramyl-(pentapeptide) pyrophosphoryl-undecaprenol N-acetylglucosamine transferase
MIIIPLGLNQSRGDQILNAKAFQDKGYSLTLEEEKLNGDTLIKYLNTVYKDRNAFKKI